MMKVNHLFPAEAFTLLLFIGLFTPLYATCQINLSVLPVNTAAINSGTLTNQQWQMVSSQMQDEFVLQLASVGKTNKLTREHILLLLKEMPSPDPDHLSEEACKIISKKENLHYLLRCSIESFQLIDKNVMAQIRIVIIEGNNGKGFWGQTSKLSVQVTNNTLNESIVLREVFNPFIAKIASDIKALKY